MQKIELFFCLLGQNAKTRMSPAKLAMIFKSELALEMDNEVVCFENSGLEIPRVAK